MLTADLAISWQRGNKITPRYIDADDPAHLETAAAVIQIVSRHQGRTRAELESDPATACTDKATEILLICGSGQEWWWLRCWEGRRIPLRVAERC